MTVRARVTTLDPGVTLHTMHGYRACPECGVAVQAARLAAEQHDCPPESFIAHQMLRARLGLQRHEHEQAHWLHTPQGRFPAVYARRSSR